MTYDPGLHRRRSIRLANYDYASPGSYFVTLCTQDKALLFGQISNGQALLNAAGQMAEAWWKRLPAKFPGLLLEEFVVMPNHLHGLIGLTRVPDAGKPGYAAEGAHLGAPLQPRGRFVGADPGVRPLSPGVRPVLVHPPALSRVLQWFKTMTTNAYFRGVRQAAWPAVLCRGGPMCPPSFRGKLWQRNYYEHIVRSAEVGRRIAAYILENPQHWPADIENPEAKQPPLDPIQQIIAEDRKGPTHVSARD